MRRWTLPLLCVAVLAVAGSAVLAAGQEGTAAGRLNFAKVQKLDAKLAAEIVETASKVAADRATALDKEQAYVALDATDKPVYYFVLASQVPPVGEAGLIGVLTLGTTKDTAKMRWMMGVEGGKEVQYQPLAGPGGRKSVDMVYELGYCPPPDSQIPSQFQQQQQQQQFQGQQVWVGGKFPPKRPPWKPWKQGGQFIPPTQTYIGIQGQGQQQQQQWIFKAPPPKLWKPPPPPPKKPPPPPPPPKKKY